ncbi:head-tail adaptor protein [uncultured Sphingomonas sp.]|uniref:head-tail adaptor protein n=1 Tax=uncultured Sphingomonas sp. TaxID=158754 RepID=UPI00374A7BBB
MASSLLRAGDLDKRIRIERPIAEEGFDDAGSQEWGTVENDVPASVTDILPSRGEKLANGINMATRPARVRMRYRDDVAPNMRFVMGDRVMTIVSGPAELGRRGGLEFMVEDYRPAGNGA